MIGVSFQDAILSPAPLTFIVLGFFIGLFSTIIYYFYSKIIGDATITQKASNTLKQVVEGVGIIAILLIGNSFFQQTLALLTGVPSAIQVGDAFHIKLADIALSSFASMLELAYIVMYSIDFVLVFFYGASLTLQFAEVGIGPSITLMPLIGLDDIINLHNMLSNQLVLIIAMVYARKLLLEVAVAMLYVMLPIGLFLRFIPITRKTGSSIIALFLAVYYVFPLSVLFSDYIAYGPEGYRMIDYSSFSNAGYLKPYFAQYVKSVVTRTPTSVGGIVDIGEAPDIGLEAQKNEFENDYNVMKETDQDAAKRSDEEILSGNAPLSTFSFTTPITSTGGVMKSFIKKLKLSTIIEAALGLLSLLAHKVLGWAAKKSVIGALAYFLLKVVPFIYLLIKYNPFVVTIDFMGLILRELFMIGQLYAVSLVALLLEITFTVTMYRQFGMLLGGEVTLLGLTKVI